MNISSGYERDAINNQKRIIRELKRIADALEKMAGIDGTKSLADYISTTDTTQKKEEE